MNYDNSGILFYNDYKTDSKHPDFKGTGKFNGTDFEVALWERKDKNGNTFYSLKFSEPFKKQTNEQSKSEPETVKIANIEDPLPF